ncbi:MAG: alpha/beta hydrolase [Phenylobacterium sp.]|uniref:alpha/beta hydrolase n=1 Tax=Phenylobacterium sp. TaxID=1871053 RepID=UPI001A626B23|nr:alpha/beta hydrolase [Phenylobacterium sp.]MBL8769779.1 alpha/beta hydrolase [Phenylobacterium sp.]
MNRLRRAALAVALALGGGSALAQDPAPPPVADPGPPLSGYPRDALRAPTPAELKTATYVRDVVYGHRDGMALTYDVFRPVKKANGALVVNMVSAGYRSSWGPPEERQARYQALIDKGFTVVALYHASAPRFQAPDAVADVRLGMRHIRLHAADYGADPGRIGAWGASAGGHLALVAGMMADDGNPAATNALERSGNRIAAVVAYFPPTDLAVLLQGRLRPGALNVDPSLLPAISPIHSVDPGDPPTLLLHGDADRGVPAAQSELMRAALDRAGVQNELRLFAGADHDFYVKGDPAKTDAYATAAMTAMVGWFERHLRR